MGQGRAEAADAKIRRMQDGGGGVSVCERRTDGGAS